MELALQYFLKSSQLRRGMRIFDAVDKFDNEARVYAVRCRDRFLQLKEKAEIVANHCAFEKYLGCETQTDRQGFVGYLLFEKNRRPPFCNVLQGQCYGLQLQSLAELAHSVQSLHEVGIYHGALAANCYFNPFLNLPVIAEPLGGCYPASLGQASPEQLRYPDEVFPGTDVWHLADFLEMVRPVNRNLRRLIRECRRHSPEARPDPDSVWETLMDLHAKADGGEWREDMQRKMRAGIRLAGLALCFVGTWWHLDSHFQARAAVAVHSMQTRMNRELSRARRESFHKWHSRHLIFAGRETIDLERLGRQVARFYDVPVTVEGGTGPLVLPRDPVDWFEVLAVNDLNWEIDEHDQIKIYPARRPRGGHPVGGDLLHQ